MSKKILIIGSGIAGIAASLKLKSYGLESTIVDKGNFIGGRIGTREERLEKIPYYYFHGTQFFSAKHSNFQKIKACWELNKQFHMRENYEVQASNSKRLPPHGSDLF